jgi:hypothetical protein
MKIPVSNFDCPKYIRTEVSNRIVDQEVEPPSLIVKIIPQTQSNSRYEQSDHFSCTAHLGPKLPDQRSGCYSIATESPIQP